MTNFQIAIPFLSTVNAKYGDDNYVRAIVAELLLEFRSATPSVYGTALKVARKRVH